MKMKRQTVQQWANCYARKQGRGTATDLVVTLGGDRVKVVESWHPGWRKYTTGEYVSNAYRNNFGWKNTYYQHAVFKLEIPFSFIAHCTDALEYLGPALKPEQACEQTCKIMTTPPNWAADCPISVEAWVGKEYRK